MSLAAHSWCITTLSDHREGTLPFANCNMTFCHIRQTASVWLSCKETNLPITTPTPVMSLTFDSVQNLIEKFEHECFKSRAGFFRYSYILAAVLHFIFSGATATQFNHAVGCRIASSSPWANGCFGSLTIHPPGCLLMNVASATITRDQWEPQELRAASAMRMQSLTNMKQWVCKYLLDDHKVHQL